MKWSKKGGVAGFIIMIVFLVIGLLAFVQFMPIALPFIESGVSVTDSALTKFLLLGIPIFTIIALIVGTIMN